jgi:hypothetical protein
LLEDPAVSLPKRFLLSSTAAALIVVGWAAPSAAQPYWGFGVGVHAPVFVGGYRASPFWLYDPWFGYGFAAPFGPYSYGYPYYYVDSSLRLEVKPKNAEVYVDGYYAGLVDDYDGTFQRLRVAPGQHEVVLYLDGYRTVRQRLYLEPNATFKVKYTMVPLPAGEQQETRPEPVNPPPQPGGPGYGRGPVGRRPPQGPPPEAPPPGPMTPPGQPTPPGPPRAGAAFAYGTLAIRVQPSDVEILIDGEPWHSPDAQDRLVVEVAEGSHTIEIRKPGYRTYITQVQVRRGETTPLNVSLRTQEGQ